MPRHLKIHLFFAQRYITFWDINKDFIHDRQPRDLYQYRLPLATPFCNCETRVCFLEKIIITETCVGEGKNNAGKSKQCLGGGVCKSEGKEGNGNTLHGFGGWIGLLLPLIERNLTFTVLLARDTKRVQLESYTHFPWRKPQWTQWVPIGIGLYCKSVGGVGGAMSKEFPSVILTSILIYLRVLRQGIPRLSLFIGNTGIPRKCCITSVCCLRVAERQVDIHRFSLIYRCISVQKGK